MGVRVEKVNSELQKALANIISYELKNPKLEGAIISVLKVDVSPDFGYAKVYVSVFPDNRQGEVFNTLKTCLPFIRREVAKKVKLRVVPELHHIIDDSEEYASKIDKLLNQIKKGN